MKRGSRIWGIALFVLMGSAVAETGLFHACERLQWMRQTLEKAAPQSRCVRFLKACDRKEEELTGAFWQKEWEALLSEPYGGSCASDTPSLSYEDKIFRTDNFQFQALAKKELPKENVTLLRFSFQSQSWKCFPVENIVEVAIPSAREFPSFALIFNGGAQKTAPPPFQNFRKQAELAAKLQVLVATIFTNNPPKEFVVGQRSYDTALVAEELKSRTASRICSLFTALFTPYITATLSVQREDPSLDFRIPMAITLRRLMTLLQWKWGVEKFILTGGSQWGISLFLPASQDKRVAGIVPSGMHYLLDMKAYLETIAKSGFTYGIRLLTPAFAREMLQELQKHPKGDVLSPVRMKRLPPLFLMGGTADEFYPLEGFLLLKKIRAKEKALYILPNTSHGPTTERAEEAKRAFFRHLLTGKPSFSYDVEFLKERAVGEDWEVLARVEAEEKLTSVSLWWACESGDGSFNNEIFQEIRGDPASALQKFLIPQGNCPHLAYFVELGLTGSPDRAFVSSLPSFPKGSPGL